MTAAIVFVGLQRHDALVTLAAGQWCTFSGRVCFRCPECGGLYDVPIAAVAAGGDVYFGGQDGPFFFCQDATCGYVRGVRLVDWAPPQPFDVSDAGGGGT